jgi:protein required for attachment to host cells
MAKQTIWVVVADGAHAAVYANHGPGQGLEEPAVREFTGDKHPTRDINADRPGRTFDSMGGGRHAKEPHTDAHRHAQQVLAHEVASFLDAAAGRGDYDRLVIAAPPRTLGDLRGDLSAKVQAKLVGDLPKDLMNLPPRDLPGHFADIVKL